MRRTIAAGLFLLTFLLGATPAAFGQATGEVLGVGFNGSYRPDCWVPMVVHLRPDTTEAGNFQIRVYQHDLDGDRAIYVRPITLNGSTTSNDQLFWMYFLPEPIHGGLPDTLQELKRDLVVFLCDANGKQLVQLPLTSTLSNVDPHMSGGNGMAPRGRKLILAVSANGSLEPPIGNLRLGSGPNGAAKTIGMTQDVEVVNLRIRDLPENPLGYDPVDAVLWLDGDPAELDAGGAHGLSALRDYVRYGGNLVVTQSTTAWQQTASFGDLLPVDVTGVAPKTDLEPLRSMAVAPDTTPYESLVAPNAIATGSWTREHPPYLFARGTPRPGAVVEDWIDWRQDGSYADATPYLARKAVGLGQVTWVAQPLTTDAQPSNPDGWPYVWAHVFGWRSDAYVCPPLNANPSQDDPSVAARWNRYRPNSGVDLGYSLIGGGMLSLSGKAAGLIALAIGFFVVYWLVAGPGTYGYLVAKKRQGQSWFLFAVAALVAAAVTVGVVKLVLRGPPVVKHLTVVRMAPGQPAIVFSRFGLYIPRDGDQTVALADTTPGQLSYLSALAEHPQQLGDVSEFPAPLDYEVPVREPTGSGETPLLTVPYRSSLKKFQARWVGELKGGVDSGGLTLDPDSGRLPLRGTITNDTGQDLTDVYLAFHVTGDKDWMVYIPTWPKGTPIDLKRDLLDPKKLFAVGRGGGFEAGTGEGKALSDELAPPISRTSPTKSGWQNLWYGDGRLRQSGMGGLDDPERDLGIGTAFPLLSVLDRMPPMPNFKKDSSSEYGNDRADFIARGGRMLNAGPSLSAGQLLVMATAKGPLPVPVEVDGNRIGGDGVTLYQFLLPIDRGTADRPTSRPVEPK
jgi:hypothetical protein